MIGILFGELQNLIGYYVDNFLEILQQFLDEFKQFLDELENSTQDNDESNKPDLPTPSKEDMKSKSKSN